MNQNRDNGYIYKRAPGNYGEIVEKPEQIEAFMDQEKYTEEIRRNLSGKGFTVKLQEGSILEVELDGSKLCSMNPNGDIFYKEQDVETEARYTALTRAAGIVSETQEYLEQMDRAPSLKATGLDDSFALLSEYNNVVLAGKRTRYGPQFVTWQRDYDRTGLMQGHYFSDFHEAKKDFAGRSGLVQNNRLFNDEQLAEVYRCIRETLDGEYPLTAQREAMLEQTARQIESVVPDLDQRVDLSNQLELEYAERLAQEQEMW